MHLSLFIWFSDLLFPQFLGIQKVHIFSISTATPILQPEAPQVPVTNHDLLGGPETSSRVIPNSTFFRVACDRYCQLCAWADLSFSR
ncbi:hypothetical protein HD806DRAFT_481921 [Xylariaceae sp. AK1471]|nr:hypothetical protein HD806DRAFT_481921 [Xylariaceae sp. AK1471]